VNDKENKKLKSTKFSSETSSIIGKWVVSAGAVSSEFFDTNFRQ
jgi:hypothetical protein